MRLKLDPSSPVPLYHQIAESLRYRIATGKLALGSRLPAVRDAAVRWGVNLHTVRRAYQELLREGLVESRGALGTRVLGARRRGPRGIAASFIDRVIREARERHHLSPADLAGLISTWSAPSGARTPMVHVVECSETQCRSHCRELEDAWAVTARPWPLSRAGEPPRGPVVATYFHYNDVRRRWPKRLSEIAFVAIQPDSTLDRRVVQGPRSTRRTIALCEMDGEKGRNIAADLVPLLSPRRLRAVPHVVARAGALLESGRAGPILFSPRVWGALRASERSDPRAVEVRYFIAPDELSGLGERFGWRRRIDRGGGER